MNKEKLEEKIKYFAPMIGSIILFFIHQVIVEPSMSVKLFDMIGIIHQALFTFFSLASLWGAYILAVIQFVVFVGTIENRFKTKKAI